MTSRVRYIDSSFYFRYSEVKFIAKERLHRKEEAVCMKKQRKWRWKRAAACLLTAAMMLTMPGISAFADETDASVTNTGGVRTSPGTY